MFELFRETFVNRRDDFALQRADGGYLRVGRAITQEDITSHLAGEQTIGSYVYNEQGACSYAVFDADTPDGLSRLFALRAHLAQQGISSYPEQSRRGGHLWVFFATPVLASYVRAWLAPFCPVGMELYPKQAEGRGYGSLIRLPFGVHRLTGKRYFFVTCEGSVYQPMVCSSEKPYDWLLSLQRVSAPAQGTTQPELPNAKREETSFSPSLPRSGTRTPPRTIRDWCARQDPFTFIRRYVDLTHAGVGCCPFGAHHSGGCDTRASFKVYTPGIPGGYCWYCYTWQQGGSVFDFLRYYYHLDARPLWQRIQAGDMA